MSAIPGIAVFDIGKTNKKFFFFDEQYKIIKESEQRFEEISDEDGFACDDLQRLTVWVQQQLRELQKDKLIQVRAINFSTYGASFVHLDASGKVVAPLYNYLKPFPKNLEEPFYARYGGREQFALETASPVLGNLNSGLQLYGIKEKNPQLFRKIKTSLHLPQYMGYLVHGKLYSDITSIGCHTALWDFREQAYHRWVDAENIREKLAPVLRSTETIAASFGEATIRCGIGLHDSSAALIPYLQVIKDPFLLLSTGTWCISMNPFNPNPLTAEELKQDCLCYLTYKQTPLKSSRLFAGNEHEQEVNKLAAYFQVKPDYFHQIPYNPHMLEEEQEMGEKFHFSGNGTAQKAYHELIRHLVNKQHQSTQLVLQHTPVRQLYVDGGFAKNEIFMHLLAKAFPELEIYAASVSQATAVGAALAIHAAWNTKEKIDHLVEAKRYRS